MRPTRLSNCNQYRINGAATYLYSPGAGTDCSICSRTKGVGLTAALNDLEIDGEKLSLQDLYPQGPTRKRDCD
jgi:hypothetical protein